MVSVLLNPNTKIFTRKMIDRAKAKLHLFDIGIINAIPLKYGKEGTLYKIDVGYYRLVSHDRLSWALFTHENYNCLFQFKH